MGILEASLPLASVRATGPGGKAAFALGLCAAPPLRGPGHPLSKLPSATITWKWMWGSKELRLWLAGWQAQHLQAHRCLTWLGAFGVSPEGWTRTVVPLKSMGASRLP